MQGEKKYMELAIELAQKGKGRVSPNPLVGVVVVLDGKVVGSGYHAYFGAPHAEIVALKEAGKKSYGASLYVNLEPCVHFGKTPPCVPEIVIAGIKRVFIGMSDPNPVNNGRGIELLKEAGVEVFLGLKGEESRKINEEFIDYIKTKQKSKRTST